jgi:hypothetical protein
MMRDSATSARRARLSLFWFSLFVYVIDCAIIHFGKQKLAFNRFMCGQGKLRTNSKEYYALLLH